ncbi:MAG TPA: hypothetical protein DEO44_01195 [Verrucomicrobia subdivision 6 bacterium]|nr:hypothetical protein [Verrucomicrobia subdivision 6 bacterium]
MNLALLWSQSTDTQLGLTRGQSLSFSYPFLRDHGERFVSRPVKARYSTWDSDLGRKVEQGKASPGGQEYLENLVNEFI